MAISGAEYWKYYISWIRYQQRDWYFLWRTAENEDAVWANEAGQIPGFGSPAELIALAGNLGVEVQEEEPRCQNLDAARNWIDAPHKKVPCHDCMHAWHFFDDLANGAGAEFSGWMRRGPVRNRVFDKLYDCIGSGRFQLSANGKPNIGNAKSEIPSAVCCSKVFGSGINMCTTRRISLPNLLF
ncbi:hypothetical protein ASU33_09540 [Solirubrum puertoriconensis]|uniref:Uncharacterized protein n=1 Tax=Solirubrum puertoriconensis TaxID=1751427 RepID=A0A9X0L589_SOLP1|nr:hypothetical protein ASU33_09540 [Solirubrum puertoriconensis]